MRLLVPFVAVGRDYATGAKACQPAQAFKIAPWLPEVTIAA